MIKITNQYNTAIVYSDVIDPGAEGLLRALCGSPLTQGSKIRIMPDVHAGKGCAVGTTMTLSEYAAPGLVGVDIGCGMTVLKVRGRKPELQHLDKLIRERVPAGRAVRSSGSLHRFAAQANLAELDCARHIMESKALRSVGTLGGGNHFIELDKGQDGAFWLIIHSAAGIWAWRGLSIIRRRLSNNARRERPMNLLMPAAACWRPICTICG